MRRSILHGTLELSKNTWLLGIQFPDRSQPSLYPIRGGNTEDLMAKLAAGRDRCAKLSGRAPTIVLYYQAGYDAFWLARFLKGRSVECLVVDSASMQVNRRARRAKTDHIDAGKLLRGLIAWLRGDRHVWSVVQIPSVDEEDLRRSHRERDYLVHERTSGGEEAGSCAQPSAPQKRKCRAICRPTKIMLGIGHRRHGETPGFAG
jgi:transposase